MSEEEYVRDHQKGTIDQKSFKFEADMSNLMQIVINSLYSNKDIFLRELISNASDALDKVRYGQTSDVDVSDLKIQIIPDFKHKTLTIRDTGIGMTRSHLIEYLGSIAFSGTKVFKEMLEQKDQALSHTIGQFGVGFYSAYLAAYRVEVTSKHDMDDPYVWSSTAQADFHVEKASPDHTLLSRGTQVVLYLKEEMYDFLYEDVIKATVQKYSAFIPYPILLQTTDKTQDTSKVIDIHTDEKVEDTEHNTVQTLDTSTKTTTVVDTTEKKVHDDISPNLTWECLNNIKPLWTRVPNTITSEEYQHFYNLFTGDRQNYRAVKHFTSTLPVPFTALLYVPPRCPADLFDTNTINRNLHIYSKQVFITDNCHLFIPKWLSFIKGIVNIDDFPLNVSRENLQKNQNIKKIRTLIVTECSKSFMELTSNPEEYNNFYQGFSKFLKLGICEEIASRFILSHLLRFKTNKREIISLPEYIQAMKPNQKYIYFLAGADEKFLEESPFLEKLNMCDIECLLLIDTMDEYTLENLTNFAGKRFVNITRGYVDLNLDKEQKQDIPETQGKLVCQWFQSVLENKVQVVVLSQRLVRSPCLLTTSSMGWSANMERIMSTQMLKNNIASIFKAAKVLEINYNHPIIQWMEQQGEKDNSVPERVKIMILMLYEIALLTGGFVIEHPNVFAHQVYDLMTHYVTD